MGLHPGQQTDLKRVLRDMVKQGGVEREGKRFRVKRASAPASEKSERSEGEKLIEGLMQVRGEGHALVRTSEGPDVFLPPHEAARALDGDRVLVKVTGAGPRGPKGKLVKVLSRTRELVIGTYLERKAEAYVVPRDTSVPPIRVPKTQLARHKDVVKVQLGVGTKLLEGEGLKGEVVGSLGREGDRSVEVLSIAYAKGFHEEFPAEVMAEADGFPLLVREEDWAGRRDLRDMQLVTIDGEDARDFDDAIFVEPSKGGWRLVVAIADVAHYVRPKRPLDVEAARRGTSVYLPGRVLPMLPERLSNGLCSLRPDEDRLCLVADLQIDAQGKTTHAELYPSVMRSQARCTYEEVHAVLSGHPPPHRSFLAPMLKHANELAQTLTGMRRKRGAIEFDLLETKIELEEDGAPQRLVRRERLESHRLVEECMLAANEAVARWFKHKGLPTVNRFHGEPDPDKLEIFASLARVYGLKVPLELDSLALNQVLEQLKGHPEARALNQLLLRSMMQAVYSSGQAGHYGLAADDYLHFTSPIRRYPDLMVHRLLHFHWAQQGRERHAKELEAEQARLEEAAKRSSERERAAMQVEREVVSFYSCLLVEPWVGDEMDGTVSALAEHGFFVELDGKYIEGMVPAETVGSGWELDPRTYRLGWSDGQVVKVGQKVKVQVAAVNLQRKQITFELVSELPRGPRVRAPEGRGRGPKRHDRGGPGQKPHGGRHGGPNHGGQKSHGHGGKKRFFKKRR